MIAASRLFKVQKHITIYDFMTNSICQIDSPGVVLVIPCELNYTDLTTGGDRATSAEEEIMIYMVTSTGLLLCCDVDLDRSKLSALEGFDQ